MKQLMLVSLLGLGGMAAAQSTVVTPERELLMAQADVKKADAKSQADSARESAAKADADEAKIRAQLDEARKRLDEAARQVADLSMKLAHNEGGDMIYLRTDGPPRSVLGVQIDPESGKEGARVLKVSPGGAAQEAGLANGDVIVALDGKNIAGDANPGRAVIDHMHEVRPEQKVQVKVLRAGKNRDFVVVARPAPEMSGERRINLRMQSMGAGSRTVDRRSGVPHVLARRIRRPGAGEHHAQARRIFRRDQRRARGAGAG